MSDKRVYCLSPRCGKTFMLKEKIKQYEREGKKVKVMDKIEPVPSSLFPDGWWSVISFMERNMINIDELLEYYRSIKREND